MNKTQIPLCFILLLVILYMPVQAKVLSPEEMLAEIDFTADIITRVHPDPFHAGSGAEFQALVADLKAGITRPTHRDRFYFTLLQLISYVEDGHTNLFNPAPQERLPFDAIWVEDGLIVINTAPGTKIDVGDKIISMGAKTATELFYEIRATMPADNPHAVKIMGNDILTAAEFLRHLELITDDIVAIKVEKTDGTIETYNVKPAANYQVPPLLPPRRPSYGWQIMADDLAWFYLDRCDVTAGYKEALKDFFKAVTSEGVQNIVIDLRRNIGGNSQVVNEMLRYLPVRRVKFMEDIIIRHSPEAAQQRRYLRTDGFSRGNLLARIFGGTFLNIIRAPKELQYHGDIYVLTSNMTASSARIFAQVFQYNNLGIIVGEPTATAPTAFGDILNFTLPHSGFTLIVSHKKFIAPAYYDDLDAVYPDYFIPTTISDLRQGIDPQLEWVREHINQK